MATAAKSTARTVKGAEAATAAFEQVTAASREAMQTNIDRSMAAAAEFGAFGKENMEAFVNSASVAQKGMEALSARYVAFTKAAMENHMSAARAMMTSKSVQELIERQTEYTKSSVEAYMAEMNAMSDMMAGLTKDAMKPLNERMSAMSALMHNGAAR
jgi:phasin family protein